MSKVLDTAYKYMQKGEFLKSLQIYKEILTPNAQELSFTGIKYRAIKECFLLAKKYPQAMQFLLKYKNDILQKIKNVSNVNHLLLIEYGEICYLTSNDTEFIKLFEEICKLNKKIAIDIYPIIEKILIKSKKWDLCSICIEKPIEYCINAFEQYDELFRISKIHYKSKYDEKYKFELCKKLETLFWILKVTDRDEIQQTLTFVRKELHKRDINCEN